MFSCIYGFVIINILEIHHYVNSKIQVLANKDKHSSVQSIKDLFCAEIQNKLNH